MFESANMTIILHRRELLDEVTRDVLLEDLDHLGRMITNFQRSLFP